MNLELLLRKTVQDGASDLHLTVGSPPCYRLHGHIHRLDFPVLDAETLYAMMVVAMSPEQREKFETKQDIDFALEIAGLARFRTNYYVGRRGAGAVLRVIPTEIKSAKQLGLPEAVVNFAAEVNGLVLVTGPTGSGKSTTLAAIIDTINNDRHDHILTVEDPIEFVHPHRNCLVNQREVGAHTESFSSALRAALREDPDVILVGEMRDLETISLAITAAETGHLVFGTLHTSSAPQTVDRIIDAFPPHQQNQIRTMLSESLRGVVAQTLLPKIGGGRVAAHEILIANSAARNLIREGKSHQLQSVMEMNGNLGMQTLETALLTLYKNGVIAADCLVQRNIKVPDGVVTGVPQQPAYTPPKPTPTPMRTAPVGAPHSIGVLEDDLLSV